MDKSTDRHETRIQADPNCELAVASGPGDRATAADVTTDLERNGASVDAAISQPSTPPTGDPTRVGRYRIIRRLGQGGFGRVYLAHDDDLDRAVAIKVPNPERVAGPEDIEAYLAEARSLARLDHPHIVPVHDVGRTGDGLCYVVSKYIEGSDLAEQLGWSRPTSRDSAELVAAVAEALHHAHTRGLVHRDVKPANILVDTAGRPCVTDFGLALRDEDFGKESGVAGTPSYMSPEQARGEGHRVDGRSDIFSLGIVFYELLTGRRPFRGDSHVDVLRLVIAAEPRPPRQLDDTIPPELERVCLKALAKRSAERYTTARDMADDLRHFLRAVATPGSLGTVSAATAFSSTSTPKAILTKPGSSNVYGMSVNVVPKGLRSFDRDDADFFLELLPGARARDGLPEGLRFWKTRIESTDLDATFKVGLIYGPSGCGKSSMIKAGLLPRLGRDVMVVYVEAAPEETEARLLRGLRKAGLDLPPRPGLVETVATLRRGRALRAGQKVLLVLDQFEQWLFARRLDMEAELVAALRQCDGEHVQALVLVRDDFWMAATGFMRDLEIDLIPDRNIAAMDLFGARHALKVLTAFGRAYGALPERTAGLSRDQEAFLNQAVSGLAQDGKIIPVRLALFAEMVREKTWSPSVLREVGGAEGVGVTFLEETFVSSQANPKHRLHREAAQAVLKALLPRAGGDIKGQMQSEAELREASGYAGRPHDFTDLRHILDQELRLITPTNLEDSNVAAAAAGPGTERCYQLTHDYLVPSLRDWLTRKQRETRRGRAELRLVERAALWEARPENRHLPSALEWAGIQAMTRRRDWTEPQQQMMQRAARLHCLRGLGLAVLIALVSWGGFEGSGHMRAAALVEFLRISPTSDVPGLVKKLASHRRWATRRLERLLAESAADSREHLHASLALLEVDISQIEYLYRRMLAADPDELRVISDALAPHRPRLISRLWTELDSARSAEARLLRSAGALAVYEPGSARWIVHGGKVAEALVSMHALLVGPWLEILLPVRGALTAPLASIFRDRNRSETVRSLTTDILADYARDDPERLAELIMSSEPPAFLTLFPVVERQSIRVIPALRAELARRASVARDDPALDPSGAKPGPVPANDQDKDELAERQTRAAVTLLRLGHADEVWPLLRHGSDPRLRSFIVNGLKPMGVDPKMIVAALDRSDSSPRFAERGESGQRLGEGSSMPATSFDGIPNPAADAMDAVLFHPAISTRRAMIQALGTYAAGSLSPAERGPLMAGLLGVYERDPDSGIHAAAEWTLRRWGQATEVDRIDAESRGKQRAGHRWHVNRQGQTFVVIEGPVGFRMGSPPDEPDREPDEKLHRHVIPRRFAIAAKEVTVEQYRRFARDFPKFGVDQGYLAKFSPHPDGPIISVNWFEAAAYCNWLSKQEGLPEDQWCYLPNDRKAYDENMSIPIDALRRTGYRLPTEAEWEYACRSGTITRHYHGSSIDLLGAYAWYQANSKDHAWKCGSLLPNDLGLFDSLGNVYEWCHERQAPYEPTKPELTDVEIIKGKTLRVYRGGVFYDRPTLVRSAFRDWNVPSYTISGGGLRVARTLH